MTEANEAFVPLLTTTDWNEEWMRRQAMRQHFDDPKIWDERAKTFPVKHGPQTGYVKRFLELANIQPGGSVLDMGCGTGALATPLAQAGHRVIACDFSQGMLDVMHADHVELGLQGVETRLMSWADDWEECGVGKGCVDVALASRSIATDNLREALMKLDGAARCRVCLTLPCGPSPRVDERLLVAAGFSQRLGRDFLYAFNILAQMGICPQVSYIDSERVEDFDTFEDALDSFSRIVEDAVRGFASEEEQGAIPSRLRPWIKQNIVKDAAGWHLAEPRHVTWAFIAWDK